MGGATSRNAGAEACATFAPPFDSPAAQPTVRAMSPPLSPAEITAALAGLPGWATAAEGDAIEKTYKFANFRDALAFIVRLGFECEAMDHHPDLRNVYNRVTLRLNTHDAGNKITAKDVELAKRAEKVTAGRG